MNARLATLRAALAGGAASLLASGFAAAADPAAELATGEGHHEPFFQSAETYVALALIVLIVAIARPAWRAIGGKLDGHAEAIKAELEEAQRLREEAQHTLAEYQRKQRDALQEAEAILAEARDEAGRIEAAAAQRTEAMLKRREQQALDMIAAAEAHAMAEVRNAAVDIAIDATRRLLTEQVDGAKADEMIDAAIADLPGKLH
jgi:F-type H+-transporting ATPase subunit b